MNFQRSALRILLFFILLPRVGLAADESPRPAKPLTEGSQTSVSKSPEHASDLVIRLANESNENDGAFGPITYGLRANHSFENDFGIEAGYIRLHEPGTAQSASVLDEAQFTVKFPDARILQQPVAFEVTAWKNRMIDMYTDVTGLQITRKGDFSVNGGFYFGKASLDQDSSQISSHFTGIQLGVSGTIKNVELAIGHMTGWIQDNGSYEKSSLEAALDSSFFPKLPVTFTFAIEDRTYRFGNDLPQSQASDRYIFVTGLEAHLSEFLFSK